MTESLYNAELSTPLVEPLYGGVLVLGNFDGVHRGHYAVIRAAMDQALRLGNVPLRVITLEPHPRQIFQPDTPPFRLTPAKTKVRLLKAIGADGVVVINFTPELSCMTAAEFIEQIVVRQHRARHVVAGFDFVFGYQRGGNMQTLRDTLVKYGIGVTEVMPFRDSRGEIMSSSRARQALQDGDTETARRILGRPWAIEGVVEHGNQRGRIVGFPTANIALGEYLRPKYGAYAVYAHRIGTSQIYPGVANIGIRPTMGGKAELLEFHLFDFYDSLYGQEWEIELVEFLRAEEKFSDIQALQKQISLDIERAKSFLSQVHL
jgi:riboflavin kinase/FMN adenylyltransferase